VPVADHVDEAVEVEVDEVAKVVELIGGRGVAPVQDVDLAAALGEAAQERAVRL
jgi:hypothetical protein